MLTHVFVAAHTVRVPPAAPHRLEGEAVLITTVRPSPMDVHTPVGAAAAVVVAAGFEEVVVVAVGA